MRRPMGLPITAGCDTAWYRTRVCSDASRTEMQCIRSLPDSGAPTLGAYRQTDSYLYILYGQTFYCFRTMEQLRQALLYPVNAP